MVAVRADFAFRVKSRYFPAKAGTTNLDVNGYFFSGQFLSAGSGTNRRERLAGVRLLEQVARVGCPTVGRMAAFYGD